MAYKDVLKNGIRTFEDLEKWLIGQKGKELIPDSRT